MMRAHSARRRIWITASAATALCVAFSVQRSAAETHDDGARASGRASARELSQYCANIAASVESARIARQQKLLVDMEAQLGARLTALEAKESEVRTMLEQLEAFERRTNDALVSFYTRMKPDAAAAQLAQLDEDIAAALLLRLKAKISGAILNEMLPERGAALAKRIADQRPKTDGKRP